MENRNNDDKIREVLAANGFSFRKKFGQNFITDKNLLADIAVKSGADKNTDVLEIGCGAGTLTRALAERAKSVCAFEIDERLKPVLAVTLAGVDNAEVVFKDFLKVRMDEFERERGEYIVVANLPYYVTTPLIMQIIEHSRKCRSLCVMVQEEVADRLCAAAGTPEYGAITAQIALRGVCTVIKRVKRDMFYPRPNVDSAVVKIDICDGRLPAADAEAYRRTVRAAFSSRRKTLENNLVACFSMTRAQATAVISECGFAPDVRGEKLSPEDFCALSTALVKMRGSNF